MRKTSVSTALAAIAIVGALFASCATTADILVNKDPEYFYGSAFGGTEDEAARKAYQDLMYRVLAETDAVRAETLAEQAAGPAVEAAFAGLKLKPFAAKKRSDTRYDVVYRLSREQWSKAEAVRVQALEAEFVPAFASIVKDETRPAAELIKEAALLRREVASSGAENLIKDGGGAVLLDSLESFCADKTAGISISASPESGLIAEGSRITVFVSGAGGAPMAGYPLSVSWESEDGARIKARTTTDERGQASVQFPDGEDFADKKATLAIASDLASLSRGERFLAAVDALATAAFSYRSATAASAFADAPLVPGGAYETGAVKQDKRAGRAEKKRTAELRPFRVMRNLVTNGEYRRYLEAVDASADAFPDYWENPDFNKKDQPVIGVSLAEADAYATWLSGIEGRTLRLPTEDEFEAAARAGGDSIYPWGDQLPQDGGRATYSGNAASTTPVGARPNGTNRLGLSDMAGNVWEWTTSAPDGSMSGNRAHRIVKGGSYMDGQYELRISNRSLRDPLERHPDVGFRLISEETSND